MHFDFIVSYTKGTMKLSERISMVRWHLCAIEDNKPLGSPAHLFSMNANTGAHCSHSSHNMDKKALVDNNCVKGD